jgi:hypothetical protein
MPSFADRGCSVVNATDPLSRILGFLDLPEFASELLELSDPLVSEVTANFLRTEGVTW